jgi:hypothetical protein
MPFLLDSGAGMTVIDSAVAAMMRLPHGGILPGAAAGGMADFSMTRIPGFTIAGVELLEQTAISFPVSGLLKEMEGMEIGGILGYDFLSRFVTRIDFERALLSCFEPDSFAAPVGATVLEAPLAHNIFTLSASLDGTEGLFYLDTGANSSLIQGTFVDSAGLARGRRTQPIEIRGAGGEEEAALCRFDSLRIGDYVLAQPVLAITRGGEGISALKNVDGIIGNDILERFTVTLDYRRQRVFLEKNARSIRAPARPERRRPHRRRTCARRLPRRDSRHAARGHHYRDRPIEGEALPERRGDHAPLRRERGHDLQN